MNDRAGATTEENDIPPSQRIAVDAGTAAKLMSCGKSTFFSRVRNGIYPKPGRDGSWSVAALLKIHQRESE